MAISSTTLDLVFRGKGPNCGPGLRLRTGIVATITRIKMARLTLKLCLTLVCTAVASAANSDELTDRQLEAQMKAFQAQAAKLQKQLAARDRRAPAAPAASPEMVTMDGSLTFKVKDGKRIGYALLPRSAAKFRLLARALDPLESIGQGNFPIKGR